MEGLERALLVRSLFSVMGKGRRKEASSFLWPFYMTKQCGCTQHRPSGPRRCGWG